MKGSLVFMLLLLAVITATALHVTKNDPQGERIDNIAVGLKGVEAHLPPSSSFRITLPEGAPWDAYMVWQFLLTPRYCSIVAKERFDTVLTIFNANVKDSMINNLTAKNKVIYSESAGDYKYYITCNLK